MDHPCLGPIERMVDLVRRISANPLGVEYKMLGEKEGFIAGMETTILLSTITKVLLLPATTLGFIFSSLAPTAAESESAKTTLDPITKFPVAVASLGHSNLVKVNPIFQLF